MIDLAFPPKQGEVWRVVLTALTTRKSYRQLCMIVAVAGPHPAGGYECTLLPYGLLQLVNERLMAGYDEKASMVVKRAAFLNFQAHLQDITHNDHRRPTAKAVRGPSWAFAFQRR